MKPPAPADRRAACRDTSARRRAGRGSSRRRAGRRRRNLERLARLIEIAGLVKLDLLAGVEGGVCVHDVGRREARGEPVSAPARPPPRRGRCCPGRDRGTADRTETGRQRSAGPSSCSHAGRDVARPVAFSRATVSAASLTLARRPARLAALERLLSASGVERDCRLRRPDRPRLEVIGSVSIPSRTETRPGCGPTVRPRPVRTAASAARFCRTRPAQDRRPARAAGRLRRPWKSS